MTTSPTSSEHVTQGSNSFAAKGHGNGNGSVSGLRAAAKPDEYAADEEMLEEHGNAGLVSYMMHVLQDGRAEAKALYGRLRWSYWLLIALSVTLFALGLGLLSSPLWLPQMEVFRGVESEFNWFATFFPPALGIVDLFGLYLYNPMRRINKLMGTMTQLIVILNQYHIRVAVRLVECQISDRSTVGAAADHLRTIAGNTLNSIERYFGRAIDEDEGQGQPEPPVTVS